MKTFLIGMFLIIVCVSSRSFGQTGYPPSSGTTGGMIPCQPYWTYEPKKDITAYEVAIIIPFLISFQSWHSPDRPNIEFGLKDLGTAARHFTKVECKK